MKIAIWATILGCVFALYPLAEEPNIPRPHWLIIATVVDRATGEPLTQSKLEGHDLEFEDAAKCYSVLKRIRPVSDENLAVVLTCQKAGPAEGHL